MVVGIELNSENVQLAKTRARSEFPGQNIRFAQSDVASFLNADKDTALTESVVILDPPRVGCAPEVMHAISRMNPSLIVYISCHPVTMARDLALLAKDQYEIVSVTPFDMFPQTDHVETIVTLRQRSGTKNSGVFAHLPNL
jgi:23S rRNA (uracil1939-C5)-methyltransferase